MSVTNQGSSDVSVAHDHLSHVMSPRLLLTVFAALVMLTILTVTASQVSFGAWEVWVSLGIASVKATLVAAYFMHLRYDKSFNGLVFISSLLFVALFLALTLMDLQGPTPS
jgi:cytochrome c oxidase subunit 4